MKIFKIVAFVASLLFLFILSPARTTAQTNCFAGNPATGCPLGFVACSPPTNQGGFFCCKNCSQLVACGGVVCGPNERCDLNTQKCVPSGGPSGGVNPQPASGPQIENCPQGGRGIKTAIGCFPLGDNNQMAKFFLGWGMGLGGGVALIIMVIASYMIMTSAGDPRKLQAGKELLTSAISGLVLLVFAAYLLKFIGVDLLGIFG